MAADGSLVRGIEAGQPPMSAAPQTPWTWQERPTSGPTGTGSFRGGLVEVASGSLSYRHYDGKIGGPDG